MTVAPERVWVGPDGYWVHTNMTGHHHVEYVRADVAASRIAALEAALREAKQYVGAYESEHMSNAALDLLTRIDAALSTSPDHLPDAGKIDVAEECARIAESYSPPGVLQHMGTRRAIAAAIRARFGNGRAG